MYIHTYLVLTQNQQETSSQVTDKEINMHDRRTAGEGVIYIFIYLFIYLFSLFIYLFIYLFTHIRSTTGCCMINAVHSVFTFF